MLAGRMKLKHFLVFAIAVVAAGVFGLSRACSSDPEPRPERKVADDRPRPPADAATATPPGPAADAMPAEGDDDLAARSYDAEVLGWRTRSISGDKLKDVSKGKPYKINVYKDAGSATVNRAKVDANRDDKWESKYTFDGETITLQRAPADDDRYTETYHWTGTGWKRAD